MHSRRISLERKAGSLEHPITQKDQGQNSPQVNNFALIFIKVYQIMMQKFFKNLKTKIMQYIQSKFMNISFSINMNINLDFSFGIALQKRFFSKMEIQYRVGFRYLNLKVSKSLKIKHFGKRYNLRYAYTTWTFYSITVKVNNIY